VVGFPARDQHLPVGAASCQLDLARQFDGGLDRFGAGGHEIEPVQSVRCAGGQCPGEILERGRGEHGAVHVGEVAELLEDRLRDFLTAVADVDDHGSAAGVQVTLAVAGFDPHALGAYGQGEHFVQLPGKYRTGNFSHFR
jgi:hypothetical protein